MGFEGEEGGEETWVVSKVCGEEGRGCTGGAAGLLEDGAVGWLRGVFFSSAAAENEEGGCEEDEEYDAADDAADDGAEVGVRVCSREGGLLGGGRVDN